MDKKVELEIEKASKILLKMVKESCSNKISENLFFILSNENEVNGENFEIIRKERNRVNSKKEPKQITQILKELSSFYEEVYDINLYVFKSERNRTIIEIRCYLKSQLVPEYKKTVNNNPAMLHCKIQLPPYLNNKKEKFDINWHLGGIIHNLKMFRWKIMMKKNEKLKL